MRAFTAVYPLSALARALSRAAEAFEDDADDIRGPEQAERMGAAAQARAMADLVAVAHDFGTLTDAKGREALRISGTESTSLDELTAECRATLTEWGVPLESADEALQRMLSHQGADPEAERVIQERADWLRRFIGRWEHAEARDRVREPDPPYDDDDDERTGRLGDGTYFANPGGNSALRAATKGNPRNLPCPTCGQPNRLTPADKARGYQCDSCADRDERGGF